MNKTAYPLCWPEGWKRTATYARKRGVFKDYNRPMSVSSAVSRLLNELRLMGLSDDDVIISTNVPLRLDGMPRSDKEPSDAGAAVYWKKDGKNTVMRCMAIDKYERVADNLAAIAATLEAMRKIERHGGAEILDRAFMGFAALPEQGTQPWRVVLGFHPGQSIDAAAIDSRFRELVKIHHPDVGGDDEKFRAITQAREAGKLEVA